MHRIDFAQRRPDDLENACCKVVQCIIKAAVALARFFENPSASAATATLAANRFDGGETMATASG